MRKHGTRLKLHDQPFQVLAMLLRRPGELVTREEIKQKLWPAGTFVDFENGLNSAINRLRDALGDSADEPKFIETIPKRGYRLIASVRNEQPEVSNSGLPAAPAQPQPEPAMLPTRPRWKRAFAWGAGIFAAIALIAIAWRLVHAAPPSRPSETSLPTIPIVTYADGAQWLPAFSPDGTRVAYSFNVGNEFDFSWYLEVKVLGSDARLRLTKQPAASPPGPAWSPDGREIAFVRTSSLEDRGIFLISALGGPERKLRTLAPWRSLQRMVSWSPDGRWIAFADEAGTTSDAKPKGRGPNALYLISPETLETRQLTTPAADELGDNSPTFSPDGKTLAFIHSTAGSQDELWTKPAQGGQAHRLVANGGWMTGVCWTMDSEWIVFDLGGHDDGFTLWRVRSKGGDLRHLDLAANSAATALRDPTLQRERLAFEAWNTTGSVGRVRLDNKFTQLPQTPLASTRWDHGARFSPRGDRIAFLTDRTGTQELWIADADGANPRQLTHLGLDLADLSWAPDGSSVAVSTGHGKIYLVSIETGSTRLIFKQDTYLGEGNNIAFSHSGRFIYVLSQPGRRQELLKVPIDGGVQMKLMDGLITQVADSVDGRTLFYSRPLDSKVPGAPGIWKRSVEGGPEENVLKNISAMWDLGSDGLYVLDFSRSSIDKYSFSGKRMQSVARLGQFQGAMAYPLSISPDGRWGIFSYRQRNTVEIEMVSGFK